MSWTRTGGRRHVACLVHAACLRPGSFQSPPHDPFGVSSSSPSGVQTLFGARGDERWRGSLFGATRHDMASDRLRATAVNGDGRTPVEATPDMGTPRTTRLPLVSRPRRRIDGRGRVTPPDTSREVVRAGPTPPFGGVDRTQTTSSDVAIESHAATAVASPVRVVHIVGARWDSSPPAASAQPSIGVAALRCSRLRRRSKGDEPHGPRLHDDLRIAGRRTVRASGSNARRSHIHRGEGLR